MTNGVKCARPFEATCPLKWPPAASEVPFLPLDLRLAVVVGPPWVLRAADDFTNDASELPGSKAGDVMPAVRYTSCVWGDSECQNAFWHLGK